MKKAGFRILQKKGKEIRLKEIFFRMKVSVNTAICSGQFGMTVLQTVFMFYYVKVFLNIFKINEIWFDIAQLLFMVWNSVNDPLFGYLQDFSVSWLKNRKKVIMYLGPLLVMSFYMIWFPWSNETSPSYVCGIHLLTVLFFYDAFYSFVNVAWSALFAESTYEGLSRITAVKYSQLAVLLSSLILPLLEAISKGLVDYFAFQCTCMVVGAIALICFYITGCLEEIVFQEDHLYLTNDRRKDPRLLTTIMKTTRQILSKRDFIVLVATHFIHNCRSVSHLNFATIVTDLLIPNEIIAKGTWKMSFLYASCAVFPQVLFFVYLNYF
ncbi:unnamed protein product [Enterobius vermicularis]|uniref:MFS domain-containing protein n=1 Tax=Enterobius vermicularis TaxID=51028 RepID=A0A0N4V0C9_ENTVE|nr:unnamed protein product [Enterobius vermicularis]